MNDERIGRDDPAAAFRPFGVPLRLDVLELEDVDDLLLGELRELG